MNASIDYNNAMIVVSRLLTLFIIYWLIRGRVSELVQYWKYIGEEQSNLGKLYLEVINSMEGGEYNYRWLIIIVDIATVRMYFLNNEVGGKVNA